MLVRSQDSLVLHSVPSTAILSREGASKKSAVKSWDPALRHVGEAHKSQQIGYRRRAASYPMLFHLAEAFPAPTVFLRAAAGGWHNHR
jgi:hypothetical protein